MSNLDFEVNKKLFNNKPTDGLKLVYSKLHDNGFFNIGFYKKNLDGTEQEIFEQVINNRITRLFIEEEMMVTFKAIIENQDSILAASIEMAEKSLQQLKDKKDISGIFAWGGALCVIPFAIGLKKFQNGDPDALKYAIPSFLGLVVSAIIYKKHYDYILSYRESKKKINEDIKEEGMKLIRKSKT